jgi:toxin-antitoxin system PIN domain toxin
VTLPDVNVLIYAFRPDSPFHVETRNWLDAAAKSDHAFGMSPAVLAAVTRILTNRRIFKQPDPLHEVLAYVNGLLEQPNCHAIHPGPRHWRIFCDLCQKTNARGDLVPDAWFAALAIESGCEWITLDRDYRRFEGLRWRAPF